MPQAAASGPPALLSSSTLLGSVSNLFSSSRAIFRLNGGVATTTVADGQQNQNLTLLPPNHPSQPRGDRFLIENIQDKKDVSSVIVRAVGSSKPTRRRGAGGLEQEGGRTDGKGE